MSISTSVIVTNWNNQDYVGRAIRSCLKQSMDKNKFEVIVVDDASTDNSRETIHSFEGKITSIFLEKNVGVGEASNVGIRNALGEFIIRVDSDDYISEHTLLFMTEILQHNKDLGFIYGDHYRVDKEENFIERVNLTTPDLLFRHGAGILFRKSYLEPLGLYDKELRNAEDFDLLRRYIRQWPGYHLPLPFYKYRQHENNMTNDPDERKKWEKVADEKIKNGKITEV